jgi:hypothetical protein
METECDSDQCGPWVSLSEATFQLKDDVKNYLAREIKAGSRDLKEAQKGIAEDWTQYLDDALAVKHGKK